jgi:prolyl-tRNA editing enzyme YbaK/EbsC (Cys-tRNA(Pro) deacylase)
MPTHVAVRPGDRIVVDRHRVGGEQREGEILQVLGTPETLRLRVKWDDGAESVFVPHEDAHIVHVPLPAVPSGAELCSQVLERAGVTYELLPHAPTDSAAAEAKAVGVPPSQVAKTVVLSTAGGRVRAVLPGNERLSLPKIRDVLEGGREIRLATEKELEEWYPMFALGTIPPFGGPADDTVLVDRRLESLDGTIIEAGETDMSLRLRPGDLVRLTGATVGDFSED